VTGNPWIVVDTMLDAPRWRVGRTEQPPGTPLSAADYFYSRAEAYVEAQRRNEADRLSANVESRLTNETA